MNYCTFQGYVVASDEGIPLNAKVVGDKYASFSSDKDEKVIVEAAKLVRLLNAAAGELTLRALLKEDWHLDL